MSRRHKTSAPPRRHVVGSNDGTSFDEQVLESKLQEIEVKFQDVPGSYPRFDKFAAYLSVYYQWGADESIEVLERLFGPRQISDAGPYSRQWFGDRMTVWRLYYRSDLLGENRYPLVVQCINAAAILTAKGLQVMPSTNPNAGNGLFVTRLFTEGSIITRYGGYKSSVDAMECLGLPDEYRQYVLVSPGGKTVFDSQICFQLGNEMGRWVNSAPVVNARFLFVGSSEDGEKEEPILVTTRDIQAGEEVFINYGPQFRLECQLCTQSLLMCQKCETPLCDVNCQRKHDCQKNSLGELKEGSI